MADPVPKSLVQSCRCSRASSRPHRSINPNKKEDEEKKMTARQQYAPGPADAQVQKEGESWTLVLVRQLHHPPQKVWQALTDPAQLHEWAPFDADGSLGTTGA